jgi:phytoene synthase
VSPLAEAGYRAARDVARSHAKSFSLASYALAEPERRAAFALYAFCRHLDDLVDESTVTDAAEGLAEARWLVGELFHRPSTPTSALGWCWPHGDDQLEALRDTLRRYPIEEAPFHELLHGLRSDLHRPRFEHTHELLTYCDRVAGTVGLMLLPVLGVVDPRARAAAVDLGRAMQLTNVLRDVREDLERGRRYLPAVELAAFQLSDRDLERGTVDERFVAFMRAQIARARTLYARAERGLAFIPSRRGRVLVAAMGRVYGGILGAIERQGYDVFSRRAHVGLLGKLALAVGAVVSPGPRVLSALPAGLDAPQSARSFEVRS